MVKKNRMMWKRSLSDRKWRPNSVFITFVFIMVIVIIISVITPDPCLSDDLDCLAPRDLSNVNESLNHLEQDDPKLVEAIRTKYLLAPSVEKYNFTNQEHLKFRGQHGQPLVIDQMFSHSLRKGFFIEAGAFDGELLSNSLRFEILHQWSGLLVEPNPEPFASLREKHRKAWLFPHCFSTKTTPEVVEFDAAGVYGGIINPRNEHKPADIDRITHMHRKVLDALSRFTRRTISIQCFPLYSILLALGNPTVHYMSLDIEGAENRPFYKVDIKILDIETNHLGEVFEGTRQDLATLLTSAGFYHFRDVKIDQIWVKKGFYVNPKAKELNPEEVPEDLPFLGQLKINIRLDIQILSPQKN
ncbi:hypothetical protein TCAL_16065 [Tigriopus californicus]|uniref:Methyltransferase FkbM domain-containing protein n=1 Tax=Tigriopus californicus TaxID=6832 RepID=A0A553PNX4_TIGCA|nr:hypothetical protein TCAL_16065 [Tigriopus californicus]